jgi:hypothetical protein
MLIIFIMFWLKTEIRSSLKIYQTLSECHVVVNIPMSTRTDVDNIHYVLVTDRNKKLIKNLSTASIVVATSNSSQKSCVCESK